MPNILRREPIMLRAVLTAAGVSTSSLSVVLNSAATASCQSSWLGLECVGYFISIILVLPIACILLWYGIARDDRDQLMASLRLPSLKGILLLGAFSVACGFLAWATLVAISTSCAPQRWGFDCSSHLVGVIILVLITASCGLLLVRWTIERHRKPKPPSIVPSF